MKDIDIHKILSLDGYDTPERAARRKGSGGSQEFFTPDELVNKMCDKVPEEQWSNPEATFLEPCAGNGLFLLAIIYRKILYGSTWKQALHSTYAVELMPDNVEECKLRILALLEELQVPDLNKDEALNIMNNNIVCSNFFDWNFENWCKIKK